MLCLGCPHRRHGRTSGPRASADAVAEPRAGPVLPRSAGDSPTRLLRILKLSESATLKAMRNMTSCLYGPDPRVREVSRLTCSPPPVVPLSCG